MRLFRLIQIFKEHTHQVSHYLLKSESNSGGARRDRTADLLRARQALSQLSYGPNNDSIYHIMVGLGGFEPPTSPLSGVRSNQLSYRPKKTTNSLQGSLGLSSLNFIK